jgi:hypothetical protein
MRDFKPARGQQLLLLLIESRRVVAMLFKRTGLIMFDVEPVTNSPHLAITRQLRRLAAAHGAITQVHHVALAHVQEADIVSAVGKELPHAAQRHSSIGAWL